MSILFSIIIPVYNVEQHIGRCLDSIINQTYNNLEIILIDDGSTDSSSRICDEYSQKDKRIKVIHQKKLGVSTARNSGLDIATGNYISFIDSDDWIEANMYQTIVEYLNDKDIDIIRFNAFRGNEVLNKLSLEGEYSDERLQNEIILPFIGAEKFGGMFILGVLWLHIYKRSMIEKHHIRFNPKLRRCEDRLFTIRAILNAKIVLFVLDILYHYEVYDESLSNKYDAGRWDQEKLYLIELHKEYSKALSNELVENANTRIKNDYMLRAIIAINNEFFSNNSNKFKGHYSNTKKILDDPILKKAIENLQYTPNLNLKQKINLQLIKRNYPLILTIFNTLLAYKHKTL